MAPESRLNAAGELPACADVVNKRGSGRIPIMGGAEKYDIITLMCDKKVFPDTQRHGRASGSGDEDSKSLTAPWGGGGLGQVRVTRCVLASVVAQHTQTCLNFSSDFQEV